MGFKLGDWLTSLTEKKDPEAPIKNPVARLTNVLSENWRGIIGTIPLLLLPLFLSVLKTRPDYTVKVIWLAMFWLLLIQPVNVPVTGMVPVFAFPCLHVLSSDNVCTRFLNPTLVLFIVGGYVLMLLNNCGFDRRAILWLLTTKNVQMSSNSLLIRSSFAAFTLSMFSNRLMVTEATFQYVAEPLLNLQSTSSEKGSNTDYEAIRNILCNAISTSSSIGTLNEGRQICLPLATTRSFISLPVIMMLATASKYRKLNENKFVGSIAILHASYAVLAMRTIWELHGATPDVFNFFQYSVFALPVAAVMFLLNLTYHFLLLKFAVKTPMSANSMDWMRNELAKAKAEISPKVTLHEILSIIFLALSLILYFFRWSEIIKKMATYMGWAHFRELDKLNNPQIADATVSSLFAIILHIIPKSYDFTKYFKPTLKKSELPPAKKERGILYWKFVDNNTCYGYILLIGGSIALNMAIASSGLDKDLREKGSFITNEQWNTGIGIICFLSVILCNVMTSVAAVVIFLPFVLNMVPPNTIWSDRLHICALAVGIGCCLGYALPFRYTPTYYMKKTGKVPLLQQIKYGIGSAIICFLVLWIALCFYADPVFIGDTNIGNSTAAPITKKY